MRGKTGSEKTCEVCGKTGVFYGRQTMHKECKLAAKAKPRAGKAGKPNFATAPAHGDEDCVEIRTIVAEGVAITLSIRRDLLVSYFNAAIKDQFGKKQ